MVDYRHFSFDKLKTKEFKHLWYLLFWPIYGIMFLGVERLWVRDFYTPIHCPLDDLIPFCEFFLIPYMFWFAFLVVIMVYTLLFDPDNFVKFMQFIMITYSATILIYLIFPNCQELRPVVFERDNIFTRFMEGFYKFDTNTNVCPSIHVIGSVAVALSAWNTEHFKSKKWRIAFWAVAVLISVSTVFLKQHSVIDILAAIPLCVVAGIIVYRKETTVPTKEFEMEKAKL